MAMRAYARQAKNKQLEVDASEIRFRAERRLGEITRRRTLMFNGYESQVASLYTGMDLRKLY